MLYRSGVPGRATRAASRHRARAARASQPAERALIRPDPFVDLRERLISGRMQRDIVARARNDIRGQAGSGGIVRQFGREYLCRDRAVKYRRIGAENGILLAYHDEHGCGNAVGRICPASG